MEFDRAKYISNIKIYVHNPYNYSLQHDTYISHS